MITGPEAGITRDSIAIDWEWEDFEGNMRPVRLIDTAGLRKKAKRRGEAGEAVGRRYAAVDRFRRGGGACSTPPAGWRCRTSRSPTGCSRKAAP